MSHKLSDIAKELGVTNAALREQIAQLGFTIGKTASTLSDEIVASLRAKAKPVAKPVAQAKSIQEEVKVAPAPAVVTEPVAETLVPNPESLVPTVEEPVKPALPIIELTEPIIVKEFASKLGRPVTEVISTLIRNGIMATINEQLDFETAAIIAEDLGFQAVLVQKSDEEVASAEFDLRALLQQDDPKRSVRRAPVISVIGHVDHGKTKLLDRIRGTAVAESEAGGITQRIGAYQVVVKGRALTFLDTPGHEAFTAMRAHGVKLTDIAILVVAADDGVMPQTIEAISHAREAGIPLVIAINKVDKPGADVQKVKSQLAEHDVLVEGWGGSTVCAEISALKGTGIEELLELLILVADLDDLKADPGRPAIGTVIESHLDLNLGPLATVLIHTGTLRLRDTIVIGGTFGRVRAMINYRGEQVESAGPSVPVRIAGLSEVPQFGDILMVAPSEREARTQAQIVKESRAHKQRARVGLSELTRKIAAHEVKELKLIVKADNKGSLEAIRSSIEKIKSQIVSARVIHAATGDISNSDIMLASVSGAVVIGFNVKALPQVLKRAEFDGVDVRVYTIIYKLLEDVEGAMRGLLTPERRRADLGIAKVLKIFFTGKDEMVVGVTVIDGKMKRGCQVDIVRDQAEVGKGVVKDLRLVNESIDEIAKGTECGIRFVGSTRLRVDDELEAYVMEDIQLTLEG